MSNGGFKDGIRTIIIKRFSSITEAKLYEARLNEANIPSFLSNTNTGQLLPFQGGGIVMHIQETNFDEAVEIFKVMDHDATAPYDADYREADHDDIEFAKKTKENEANLEKSLPKQFFIFILIVIVFIYLISEVLR